MSVSTITSGDIVSYLKLTTGEYIEGEITTFLAAAKAYIKSYTGMTTEEVDTHDDLVPVATVSEYLQKSHIDTTVFRQFKHSQFLISEKFQLEVLKTLERLEEQSTDV